MAKVKLGEIYKVSSGGTPSKSHNEYYDEGEIKWVKTGDLKERYLYDCEDCITEEGLNNSSARMYEPDTVLIAMYGATIGATSILKTSACTNQACAAFVPTEKVIPEYLYYFFRSKKEYFIKDGVGGAQPNISAGYLRNVEMELLEINEQQKVVDLLGKVESVIDFRKRELEQLDLLIRARFVEMFGDPGTNEKKFEIKMIGDLSRDVRYGTSKPAVEGGKHKYLRMNNMTADGYLDFTDLKYINISGDELEKCVVRKGDILFNRTNSIELVGKTAVFHEDEDMVIAGYIIRVRLVESILPIYLSAFMNLDYSKLLLRNMAKGAVNQANINAQELQSIYVMVPPIELQNQFVDFVQQVDKSKVVDVKI